MTLPLVPAEVDLREFQYMELDVRRLRDSRFASITSGEGFRAGLLLWCASWHQQPAASLPDDDVELAQLAGFGRVVKEFRKIRDEALYGWVKCSDGRWYHEVVAEKALAAWTAKLHHAHRKLCDRLRKENKQRTEAKQEPLPIPTFDEWDSERRAAGIPPEPIDLSGGIPAESGLKGNGTERRGDSNSGAKAPGAGAPTDTADTIYSIGVPLLTAAGVTEPNARKMLGKFRKDYDDNDVIDALTRCATEKPLQPIPWMVEALKPKTGRSKPNGAGGVPWWSSEATIIAEGKKHGLEPKAGESMPDYKGRVSQARDAATVKH